MLSACRYFLLALLAAASSALGQTPAPTPTPAPAAQASPAQPAAEPMPTDPAALLALAAKKNGLQNLTSPWHLKASFEVFDDRGRIRESGTFEELWVSANRYKRNYSSSTFHQTDYSTADGVFRVGDPDWPTQAIALVERAFLPQFPTKKEIARSSIVLQDEHINGAVMSCVLMRESAEKKAPPSEVHCFDKQTPAERIGVVLDGSFHTVYNDIRLFRTTYIARSTGISLNGKPFLAVRIDSLEPLSAIDEKALVPTADASPVNRRVLLTRGDVEIASPPPSKMLPSGTIPLDFQGSVVVRIVIDKDGRVREVEPLNVPAKPMKPFMDLMRQTTFKPYKNLGDGAGEAADIEILNTIQVRSTPRYIN